MQFKELEWLDIVSDGVIVSSHCIVRVYDSIRMEFRINHEKTENVYYLHSFGKGSIRRLQPEKFNSVEDAKMAAYRIYNNEMCRMRKAIDLFWKEEEVKNVKENKQNDNNYNREG